MAAIPTTQTACVCAQKGGPLKVDDKYPVKKADELQSGEILVKLHYSGVCHSDYHLMGGEWSAFVPPYPLIGGHEGTGEVVAIGQSTKTDIKIGDKVGVKWIARICLQCEFCRKGFDSNCPHMLTSGGNISGTFQQYVVSYADYVTPIPDNVPLELAAPIMCAGVGALCAVRNSGALCGETVVIPGAGGGLGHLVLQYAHAMGLRTIAIDTGKEKEKLCKELGAAVWIDFKEEKDIVAAVRNATQGGLGAHASIVATDSAEAYKHALDYLRSRGTMVIIGLPDVEVQVGIIHMVSMNKRIVSTYVGNRQEAIEALHLVSTKQVLPRVTIEPLANLQSVYEKMAKGELIGRVVLKCF